MSREATVSTDVARAVDGMAHFPSTRLATGIGSITREVMRRGAALITKHDQPVMVLMSVERYAQLEKVATPDLGALTQRFDALYARMQAPGADERVLGALDLTPARSARRSRRRS
jgi:hypothetical protein